MARLKPKTVTCPKCGFSCKRTEKQVDDYFGWRRCVGAREDCPQSYCRECRKSHKPTNAKKKVATKKETGRIVNPKKANFILEAMEAAREETKRLNEIRKEVIIRESTAKGANDFRRFSEMSREDLKALYAKHYPNDKQARSAQRMIERLEKRCSKAS